MNTPIKPVYEHDCAACKFLGSVMINGRIKDVYVCDLCKVVPSMIVREGSDPCQYTSTIVSGSITFDPFMCAAFGMYLQYKDAKTGDHRGKFWDTHGNVIPIHNYSHDQLMTQ